jgi:tRNA (uracil-5-)-methyltransferase
MKPRKRQKIKHVDFKEGSNEEVLQFEIAALLKSVSNTVSEDAESISAAVPAPALPEPFAEIELQVAALSSTGDGLALPSSSDHVYVVPFSVPGDTVTAKVVKHFPGDSYSLADFIRVVKPSKQRDDSLPKCKYFSTCSGCQLQMLPYDNQLAHKKTIIEKAYRNFSGLDPSLFPTIGDTIGSPLQYGYRTKLTPHFDGPPQAKRRPKGGDRVGFDAVPPIGYTLKGRRHVFDVEDCPIGTDAVREGMKSERKRIADTFATFKRGATLLLRESTERKPKTEALADENGEIAPPNASATSPEQENNPVAESKPYTEEKTCITDQNGTSIEYVDDFVFHNRAGAFFQNNNSILPKFTAYIRDRALPPSTDTAVQPIKYLLDAYSGSGLFTITLSSIFSSSLGIDIDGQQIAMARKNAAMSNVPNARFMDADASTLFAKVTFPADETLLVIDPPRKGCDGSFLKQLLEYGPRRVVYVSCNVHSQARDVGVLVSGNEKWRYGVESVRGFDFFPQTGHVEGVAILNRQAAGEGGPVKESSYRCGDSLDTEKDF